jgi:hypothetical protein
VIPSVNSSNLSPGFRPTTRRSENPKARRSFWNRKWRRHIEGFFAYCGRYEIDEAKQVLYHYPEVAWVPNFVGTKQERPYRFDWELLTFSGKATDEPGVESWTITWRKVK